MGLTKGVELHPIQSFQSGHSTFFTPQTSNETIVATVAGNSVEDLFVHHAQTDQLFVVQGSLVVIVLYNREYHYIPLTAQIPQILKIPPGIPHGGINPNPESCMIVNALIRHGEPHSKDYQAIPHPFPYDFDFAYQRLKEISGESWHDFKKQKQCLSQNYSTTYLGYDINGS